MPKAERRKVDPWVIRAVYEAMVEYVNPQAKDFRLSPDDSLFEFLELDREDMEFDIVPAIADRCGRSIEKTEDNPYYNRVKTVRDLVMFLNCQPRL